jgi:hypothetical protein
MNVSGSPSGHGLYGWCVLMIALALLIVLAWIVFRGREAESRSSHVRPGTATMPASR